VSLRNLRSLIEYKLPTTIVKLSKMISMTFAFYWLLSFSVLIQGQIFPVMVAAGQEEGSPTTTEFVNYDGMKKYGISIEYPANWNITEDASGVWFISPVESGNVRITSQPARNLSLVDLVQIQNLQTKNSNKELNIVSSNMTTLDGTPANRTDYKFKVEVPKLLGADIFDYDAIRISGIKDDKLYTLTYFATPETFYIFLPVVQKMLSTLNIMNAGGQTQEGLDTVNPLVNSTMTNSTIEIVSTIGNVKVNGFDIISPHSTDVDLIYSGSGKAPSLKVDSYAISLNSALAQDIINQIGMINPNSTDFNTSNSSNSTSSLEEKIAGLSEILSVSNGTKSLDSGWKSPATITIDLNGNATLSKADFIGITVHE
jgi:hypothetical protein